MYGDVKVCYSTAEVKRVSEKSMTFRSCGRGFEVCLQTKKQPQVGEGASLEYINNDCYQLRTERAECVVTFA